MRKAPVSVLSCCALMLALGLAGCGGNASPSTPAQPGGDKPADTSVEDAAKAEYDRASALFGEGKFYSAKQAFEKSAYGDWEQRAAACVQAMPETGELFHDPDMASDSMILEFVVNEEDANKGCYISVFTKDNKLAETLFIKGGGTVQTRLPGGEYSVKDSNGTEWYGENEQFGPNGYYETMVFDEVEGAPNLTVLEDGYQYTITINGAHGVGQTVGSTEGSWDNR